MTQDELNKITTVFNLQKSEYQKNPYLDKNYRVNKLLTLLKVIYESQIEIEEAIYKDFKKPGSEVKLTEIFPVLEEIKFALKNITKWLKYQKVKTPIFLLGTSCKILFEPKGVCLIISPWNFPFQLTMSPLVSAIAAGNRVIIKPSEYSANTSALIKKLVNKIFNKSEVEVFEGDYNTADVLLNLPFDHIFFTGSCAVGKIVMEKAAKNLSSVTLELGGKSPVVIDEHCDINKAAKRITWGKFINCGQICIAPDYVIIHESIKNEFIKKLEENILSFYGNSIKESPDYTGIINAKHQLRIVQLIEQAKKAGANIVFGGENDINDCYIEPTIITDVNLNMEIMKEEIFGPVLPIITYIKLDEIYEIINKNPIPLALYIFSKRKKFINEMLNKISAGNCAINDVILQFINPFLPFGGVNNSGIGKSHGFYGFKEFSNEKGILKQQKLSAMELLYPPYTANVKKIISLIVKYL
ncbi:MAG: aldehyde dehydrogenase family protein [bacterium]